MSISPVNGTTARNATSVPAVDGTVGQRLAAVGALHFLRHRHIRSSERIDRHGTNTVYERHEPSRRKFLTAENVHTVRGRT